MSEIWIMAWLLVALMFGAMVAPPNMPAWWQLMATSLIILVTWALVRMVNYKRKHNSSEL